MSEQHIEVVARIPPEDPVVELVMDEHASGSDLATRLRWRAASDGRRVTVTEAIEMWAAADAREFDSPEERVGEAAEWVIGESVRALAAPIVGMYPDLGGAARPCWNELVDAIAHYPESRCARALRRAVSATASSQVNPR